MGSTEVGSHGMVRFIAVSNYKQDVDLTVRAFVDNDFEIDKHGRCSIVTLIYLEDDEEPVEAQVELEGVVDGILEFYDDPNSYQKLYSLAHEFSRQAERLREVAIRIEDSDNAVRDLYDE